MPKDKQTEAPPPAAATPATPPKRYDEAFKRQAVEHWMKSGQRGTQIARDRGVSYPALQEWKRRCHGAATPARAEPEAEIRARTAELARVRAQCDILKSARHPLRTTQERDPRLEAMSAEHAIAQLCAALDMTRSGYHAWQAGGPSTRQQADTALRADLRENPHPTPPAPRRSAHPVRTGAAGPTPRRQKRIARRLRVEGLRGCGDRRAVPRTTDRDHDQPSAPNRLAEAPAPSGPNPVWVSDLT